MLQLKNIVKNYAVGDNEVKALRGIDLAFRDSEFVAILGPSGCGKTTLLNIIGGLDIYTDGDLLINGRSTKEYKDGDWDTYRNHSIGFVFQSYNLIPHQSVLSNVELALTLSGVSKSERRRRAKEALEAVGLGDQLHKRPNQMSGGQMQRVAIARSLVNNPDILLADEPTGALDTETSVQIMEILKDIAKERLIIMVTHNPELAEKYATRTVTFLDGRITGDSDPYTDEEIAKDAKAAKTDTKKKKPLSTFTAFGLSFNNLLTKRTRTFLTAFAGSIGIIGIALILALSTGIHAYVEKVQKDTLSSYPVTIYAEGDTLSDLMSSSTPQDRVEHEDDAVYTNPMMSQVFNSIFASQKKQNNLTDFKAFLDKEMNEETSTTELHEYASLVQYSYNVPLNIYVKNKDGKYTSTDIAKLMASFSGDMGGGMSSMFSSNLSGMNLWSELLPGKDGELIADASKDQYELIKGKWPEKENEILLIVNSNNEITDFGLYALGLMTSDEVLTTITGVMSGKEISTEIQRLEYEDIFNTSFRLILNSDYYQDRNNDGIYEDIRDDEAILDIILDNALKLEIVGIVKSEGPSQLAFAYTSALTEWAMEKTARSTPVILQRDEKNENFDILSGLPFVLAKEDELTDEEKRTAVKEYFSTLTDAEKADIYAKIVSLPSDEYLNTAVAEYMKEFDTREKLEKLASSSYGMDEETMKSYLASYTDDELKALVENAIKEVVKTQYEEEALKNIEAIKNTPSDSDLAMLISSITARLTTPDMIIGYIANDWAKNTTMSMPDILAYLSKLDATSIASALDSTARKQAMELYPMYAAQDKEGQLRKVAAAFDAQVASADESTLISYYELYMPSSVSSSTLKDNLTLLGVADKESPSVINIYSSSFESKDVIGEIISDYNETVDEDDRINYTDYVALLMSGITDIINAITYGLIVFVSVSLVVSSIMIGIITYISVLERTKEIGILRAIGASKKDISRVFNAETLIVGFSAGALGIGLSLLLCIPINIIVHAATGITDINAFLKPEHCFILVVLSMALTLIAGFIPSKIAAKKDPVVALRTE